MPRASSSRTSPSPSSFFSGSLVSSGNARPGCARATSTSTSAAASSTGTPSTRTAPSSRPCRRGRGLCTLFLSDPLFYHRSGHHFLLFVAHLAGFWRPVNTGVDRGGALWGSQGKRDNQRVKMKDLVVGGLIREDRLAADVEIPGPEPTSFGRPFSLLRMNALVESRQYQVGAPVYPYLSVHLFGQQCGMRRECAEACIAAMVPWLGWTVLYIYLSRCHNSVRVTAPQQVARPA